MNMISVDHLDSISDLWAEKEDVTALELKQLLGEVIFAASQCMSMHISVHNAMFEKSLIKSLKALLTKSSDAEQKFNESVYVGKVISATSNLSSLIYMRARFGWQDAIGADDRVVVDALNNYLNHLQSTHVQLTRLLESLYFIELGAQEMSRTEYLNAVNTYLESHRQLPDFGRSLNQAIRSAP